MIRVAIAVEHGIVRWALRELFAKSTDLVVVGEAGSVDDTLEMIRRTPADVLLLDTAMPDHTGFDVLNAVRELAPGPLVIVLAPQAAPAFAARVLAAGAHGYIDSSIEPAQLMDAIRAVNRGERIVPPGVEPLLAAADKPAGMLTARETQVMEMLARGMTNREIAEHLDISVKTIDTHRGHVMKKLGLRNNSELTRFAVKHGYVAV
jgi:DNA-binding NarL/FixJ family response regulator